MKTARSYKKKNPSTLSVDQLQQQLDLLKAERNTSDKAAPRIYLWGFYIVLILFIVLGAYMGFFIYKSRQQVTDLNNKVNEQTAQKDSVQQLLNKSGSDLTKVKQENNLLQSKLNQKPNTVYVPQQPATTPVSPVVPTFPKQTTCNPNFSGGFTCY